MRASILWAIIVFVAYMGCAIAKAPKQNQFKWELSYSEFIEGSPEQGSNTTIQLNGGSTKISFEKTGWSCGIIPAEPFRDLSFHHEGYRIGCTRDGKTMMAVTHFCSDYAGPASPISLFNESSKYQARIVITCDSLEKK